MNDTDTHRAPCKITLSACSPGHALAWLMMASLQIPAGLALGLTLGEAMVLAAAINLSLFGPPGRTPPTMASRPYDTPFSIN